jgi:hypothetical protein
MSGTVELFKDDAQWLTAKEIGAVFNIHPHSLLRLAKLRKVPHVRIGGSVRFRLKDVEMVKPRGDE